MADLNENKGQGSLPIDSRIDELELRCAMQEHSLQELSDEHAKQQQEIAVLQQQVQYLAGKLKNFQEDGITVGSAAQERPPHY